MDLYEKLEQCCPTIETLFTSEQLKEFMNTPRSDLYLYHFTLGSWLRNNWLYSKASPLYRLFVDNGIEHHDVMSSIIIKYFYYYLLKKNTCDNTKTPR